MKNRLLFIVVTIFLSGLIQAKTLKVGVYSAYPHIFAVNEEITGPAINYIEEALNQAGLKYEFKMIPIKRGLKQLENDKLDLLIGLAKTQERQDRFSFIKTPVAISSPCLITKKSNTLSKKQVLGLGGELLIPGQFITDKRVKELLKKFKIASVHDRKPLKAMMSILTFKEDVYGYFQLCDENFFDHYDFRTIPLFGLKTYYYIGHSRALNPVIVQKVNKALKDLNNKGSDYTYYFKKFSSE